jgi:hypothetical protein
MYRTYGPKHGGGFLGIGDFKSYGAILSAINGSLQSTDQNLTILTRPLLFSEKIIALKIIR